MSIERPDQQSGEKLPLPTYTIVELSTPTELERAVAFDTAIFSENRRQYEGEDVTQPTVDISEYEHLVENGGRVIAFLDDTNNEIMALCTVALQSDPEALEPMLKTMDSDTAYMTVAAVKKEYRGQGLGHKMLQARLDIAREAGKTKAITTVHSTNIASMNNLLKAGFLGVARVDNYYNMRETDGERIVMLNGNIFNPDWAEQSTDTSTTVGLNYIEPKVSSSDSPLVRIQYFIFSEQDFCIFRTELNHKGGPTYSLCKFVDNNDSSIPRLLYPHASFGDAYTATQNLDMPQYTWSSSDKIIHISMDGADLYWNHIKNEFKYMPILEAVTKKNFVDWVNEYRAFIQSTMNEDEITVFSPSFSEANIVTSTVVDALTLVFLDYENTLLWSVAKYLPRTPEELSQQGIQEPDVTKDVVHALTKHKGYETFTSLYLQQNPLLHQYINAYHQDFAKTLPWPYNKEGFMNFQHRICRLLGKQAFNPHNLYLS